MVLVAALAMMLATAAPAMASDWDGNGLDDETGYAVFNDWNGDGFDDYTGLLIVFSDFSGDGFDDNNGGGNSFANGFGFGDSFPFGGGGDGDNNNGGNNNGGGGNNN